MVVVGVVVDPDGNGTRRESLDTIINVDEQAWPGGARQGRARGDMHAPTNMLVSETSELGDTSGRASWWMDDGLIAAVAPSGPRPISPDGPKRPD